MDELFLFLLDKPINLLKIRIFCFILNSWWLFLNFFSLLFRLQSHWKHGLLYPSFTTRSEFFKIVGKTRYYFDSKLISSRSWWAPMVLGFFLYAWNMRDQLTFFHYYLYIRLQFYQVFMQNMLRWFH